METMMPPQSKTAGLGRRLARLLRRKRTRSGAEMAYSVAGDEFDQSLDSSINSLSKLKLSGNLVAAYSLDALFIKNAAAAEEEKKKNAAAAKHAFVASLFAGASSVKAAYAQLQLAQRPYDSDAIQAADAGLVAELTRLSEMKRRYARDPAAAALAAQAEEQRHLLRTYEVTARKLEAELRARDAEADRARAVLARALEEEEERRASPRGGLEGLHHSGLDTKHFLAALRHAVMSVRSFARTMLDAMGPAGYDPVAAAATAHPGARLRRPGDARFALESFVALNMFASFQRRDLGLAALRGRGAVDRRAFFEEFRSAAPAAASSSSSLDASSEAFREFVRERYLSLVHERMEAAFFGRWAEQQRAAWFAEFAEMSRRVWVLHYLFHGLDGGASVFQARAGSRFSEAYMERVTDDRSPAGQLAVGFTVVPGFKVGRTVIQCRVYLSSRQRS
jgi:hypothetical protein